MIVIGEAVEVDMPVCSPCNEACAACTGPEADECQRCTEGNLLDWYLGSDYSEEDGPGLNGLCSPTCSSDVLKG